MTYTNKTLRQQYRLKAHYIGSNAIKLVDDFFKGGIEDKVDTPICKGVFEFTHHEWTLTDLDRALDEMKKQKSPA